MSAPPRDRDAPVRVIHSVPVWLPRTQTWLHQQVRGLPEQFESHVVCEWTENLDAFAVPRLHPHDALPRLRQVWDRRLRRWGLRSHLSHLPALARRLDARILHSHFGNTGWSDWRIARRFGLRHVVTFYGHDLSLLLHQDPRWHARYRELFGHVDRVLCEGPAMSQRLRELGCPPERLRVPPLGVDVERFAFRTRTREPDEPLRVLIAASFTEKKGIPDALAALARVAGAIPLEITLIGDSSGGARNDAEKRRILQAVRDLELGAKIRWLGYQPHEVFLREAHAHHVYLSPSLVASDDDCEGGAPVGLIEAAATGMAVVSTRHCDIPEVIEDGVGGLLAPERDVGGLADHLRALFERPERMAELGRNARRRIEGKFDRRRRSEELAAIYRSLL